MGYYTSYSLEVYEEKDGALVRADKATERKAIADLRDINDELSYAVDEDGNCSETTKWYTMEDEMSQASKARPDLVFCVSSDGEESPDFAKTWFNDGRMSQCIATVQYPEPDLSRLFGKTSA